MSATLEPAARHGPALGLDIRYADPLQASELVALAMNDNPTHAAVFGGPTPRRQRRMRVFFDAILPWIAAQGLLLGAHTDDRLVAVLGLLPPGRCQPRGLHFLRLGARLLLQLGPLRALRLVRWQRTWGRVDPAAAHWHLGPLAVRPEQQHQGVGTALLHHGLARVDSTRTMAYLETDLARNVALYQRLGFAVTGQARVLGVPNWFMQRPAASPQGTQPPCAP